VIDKIPVFNTPAEGVDFLDAVDQQEAYLKKELEATRALRHELETLQLPELFDRFEQPEAVSNSGAKAIKKLDVAGSLPKVGEKDTPQEAELHRQQREAAIKLAESYEWQPFIKSTVTAKYDKGDQEKAREAYRLLRGDNSAEVDITEGIHAQTLCAQVRKRLREGKEVALDVLGVTAIPSVLLTKKSPRS
jgi:hypothetical protein